MMCRDVLIETEFGYCSYDIDESEGAFIYNLYVYEEHRRKGKAREILCAAIDAIRSSGYEDSIGIEARPKYNSIPKSVLIDFYRRLGLKVVNADTEEINFSYPDTPKYDEGSGTCSERDRQRRIMRRV
jgi:ribosomal protein S18 acetylase RimI-like enzyme